MEKKVLERFLDIQEQALHDEGYIQIYRNYQAAQGPFLRFLTDLQQPQQDIILRYIGACADLHHRLMEIACEDTAKLP